MIPLTVMSKIVIRRRYVISFVEIEACIMLAGFHGADAENKPRSLLRLFQQVEGDGISPVPVVRNFGCALQEAAPEGIFERSCSEPEGGRNAFVPEYCRKRQRRVWWGVVPEGNVDLSWMKIGQRPC